MTGTQSPVPLAGLVLPVLSLRFGTSGKQKVILAGMESKTQDQS